MAITCPSWGSTCPLWLASNQYGQDLKARAHKSEFAASTSRIFQLRNLKSPEISETFSRNFSLFPNMLHYLQTSEMPSRGVWPQQRQLVAPPYFPKPSCGRGRQEAPTTPTRNRAIVESFGIFDFLHFFSGFKRCCQDFNPNGFKAAQPETFHLGILGT